ncbi:MAG: hypothetical protein M3Y58_11430 [Chloroflexota bacterium]|nr:hypothetical protein [Chloroflexota bacterium]
MTQIDYCRQLLAETSARVAATLPGRARALLALLRAGDTMALGDDPAQNARPGWNLALRLCLERQDDEGGDLPADRAMLAAWAERFLADCDQLALASLALAQCASGHLQLQQRAPRTFVAWATSRHLSTEQRERADFDWWAAHVTRQVAPRLATLLVERPRIRALLDQGGAPFPESGEYVASDPTVERYYRQLGQAHVARFSCQHSYPADGAIGGATFGQYSAILALLIGWLHRERDHRASIGDYTPTLRNERAMIAALAAALDTDPSAIGRALQPFILDRDNAAYDSALPGRAAPPLIRLDEGRVVWSARGLLGEPLIFLARELRRRHAQEYHNSASLREGVFRQDLYRLFSDRRFVLSAGRVELKRSGEARTDLDALIFDRKTGTLGVFELKSQDPFARSVEERQRQRDNFFHANRQVSAILEWVQRHGPDDLLARFDERAAKRFHVQKVYVFVLGRYLAHFVGGPEPDHRAAWGSWPQVLQVVGVGNGPFDPDTRNPLGALFARLRDATPLSAPTDADSKAIAVGDLNLRIFPSFAAMRSAEDRPA